LVRVRTLVAGALAGSALFACENPGSPFAEADGVLAYTDAGSIHVLDLANRADDVIHTAEAGTDIRNVTWAPDGTSLVFHTYEFGQHTQFVRQWKMYSISADGAGISLMFDRGGPEIYPAYGPDGRLAYWGNDGLYIDGWATYTTTGTVDQSAPTWSPDGRHIVFASRSDLLRVTLADTSETETIFEVDEIGSTARDPAYSPDGTRLAFVREFTAMLNEIWIVATDGTESRSLTEGHRDRHPVWSRDGSTIAFVRNENSIYTIGIEPGSRIQILLSHPVEHIAWVW